MSYKLSVLIPARLFLVSLFIAVTLDCFSCYLPIAFSVRPKQSSLMTQTVAGLTFSSPTILGNRQWMAVNAVSAFHGLRDRTSATRYVSPTVHQFQMYRITAAWVTAKMVDLGNYAMRSSWNWPNGPSVKNPMGTLLLSLKRNESVPFLVFSALPYPAASKRVFNYSSKDSSNLLNRQARDCEILNISHCVTSIQVRSWIGPLESLRFLAA